MVPRSQSPTSRQAMVKCSMLMIQRLTSLLWRGLRTTSHSYHHRHSVVDYFISHWLLIAALSCTTGI